MTAPIGNVWGPMMGKLSAQEQVFVCLLFENLGSITRAAERAGYKHATRAGLRMLAHRLLHKASVADAVVEESRRRTVFLAPRAQEALRTLLFSPTHPDHMKAIKLVRDDSKVSIAVDKVIQHKIDITVTQQDKLTAIKKFAESHGMDVTKLLGFDPETPVVEIAAPIDAEFVELTAEEEDRLMGLIP